MRITIEGLVIVASILLSFGIEAGWSERQEREDEAEAIAQLATDFDANAARLATIRSMHEQALDANYEILALAGLGGPRKGTQSTAELVLYSLRAWMGSNPHRVPTWCRSSVTRFTSSGSVGG